MRRLAAMLCAMVVAVAARAMPPANDPAALAQALASALRQLDLREPPPSAEAPRLRYHARITPGREGGYMIDLARYNLGDAVRREAIAEYGAGRVAAPAAFGVGPHVAWRFDLRRNATDAPVPAARAPRRIGNAQAASNRCGPRPCLALYDSATLAAWRPLPSVPPSPAPPIDIDEDQEPPARIALVLLALPGSLHTAPRAMELVIDLNLGNDTGSEALLFLDGCLLRRRATASAEGVWADYAMAGAGCAP